MKITELETVLEQLVENKSVNSTRARSIMLNNMLAICRNLSSLQSVINSFGEKDEYIDDISFLCRDFSASYCHSTIKKLRNLGIDITDEMETDVKQTPVVVKATYAPPPYQDYPQYPQMMPGAPYPAQPYPPTQPGYPNGMYPQYQQAPQPQAPTQFAQPQPFPQQQYAQPQQQMPQQPANPAPKAAQQPAPQASYQTPQTPSQPQEPSQPSQATSSASDDVDFNFGFGGSDKPAKGRDFLLDLLNGKNGN